MNISIVNNEVKAVFKTDLGETVTFNITTESGKTFEKKQPFNPIMVPLEVDGYQKHANLLYL